MRRQTTDKETTRLPGAAVREPARGGPVGGLLSLQATAGNQAVTHLVQRAINLADHENVVEPTKGHAMTQHVNVDNNYLKARG